METLEGTEKIQTFYFSYKIHIIKLFALCGRLVSRISSGLYFIIMKSLLTVIDQSVIKCALDEIFFAKISREKCYDGFAC